MAAPRANERACALLRGLAADAFFNRVKLGDAAQGFRGDRRARWPREVQRTCAWHGPNTRREPPRRSRSAARSQHNRRPEDPAEAAQMRSGSFGLSIGTVEVDLRPADRGPAQGRSSRAYAHNRPVLVRPRPGSSTEAAYRQRRAWWRRRDWRRAARGALPASPTSTADPVGQGRAIEIDALARKDLCLSGRAACDRNTCWDQHLRHQPGRRHAALAMSRSGAAAWWIVPQARHPYFGR